MKIKHVTGCGLLAAAWLLFLLPGYGQQYNFRHFDASRGLPDRIVNTIGQDSDGFLWVGGGTGLYRFDGFDFHRTEFPDSSDIRFATSSYTDATGRFWLGTNDGKVYYAEGGVLHEVPDIDARYIVDISSFDEGALFILTRSEGIFRIEGDDPFRVTHFKAPGGMFLFSFLPLGDDTFFAGSDESLLLLRTEEGSLTVLQEIHGMGYSAITGVVRHDVEGVYLAANEDGLYTVLFSEGDGNYTASRLISDDLARLRRIESLYRDKQGDLWASTTGSGAVRITFKDSGSVVSRVKYYTSSNGLAGDDVRRVFQDNEGNYWIALFGDALSQLVSEAFTFYRPGRGEAGSVIYTGFNGEYYLFGTPGGYYLFDLAGEEIKGYESLAAFTRGTKVISYFTDNSGIIWFATEAGELFRSDSESGFRSLFRGEGGESRIDHISMHEGALWLSTRDGISVINASTGERITRFTTRNRLPHNRVNQVYHDSEGNTFVATEAAGLYRVDIERGITPEIMLNGVGRNVIQAITRSADGTYWLATLGNGLFAAGSDSVTLFTTGNGLFSNFCYSILADREGRVWTGHERGFSRYNPRAKQIQTFSTDFAGDGNCNPNAIYESEEGVIFIGTTAGVIVYDRRKDLAGDAVPFNNIVSVTINDKAFPTKGTIVLPYGRYIARVEYAGISLTNPSMIRHRTFMDNYDLQWGTLNVQRQVTYRLPDGVYRFSMESVGESGIPVLSEEMLRIVIKRPPWRSWWFILLVMAFIAGIVFLIVNLREKKQKEITLYLENELQARTIEVVKQKEEIEQQNIEITDSINYARRIQSSILPDEAKLKESFHDAFIIFIPRDIVSGDFYWFERLDEERFVLVCADSTGHGVPGAFMSMIGSTLLQDIITRKGVTRPSQVLELLDQQVFSTLNRNLEVGVSNDGMDVVVCEINIRTRHVRFSSAMRPVIMVMGGEMYYIKGNRSSVGGEAYMEKFFDDQEYYLSEGDSIYLFSDGLPDQFGGENGKKMKIARLKRLIEGIKDMPMERQKQFISDFYYDWKGSQAQVDDIIFMGIRF